MPNLESPPPPNPVRALAARLLLAGWLGWAIVANAATGSPASASPPGGADAPAAGAPGESPTPVPWPSVQALPVPVAVPSGSSAPGGVTSPNDALPPGPTSTPAGPALPGGPASALPSTLEQSRPSPGRFELQRPGTDVVGDSLSGSLASNVFILKGHVTLHSDPKIDHEIAAASESTDPLTVTADEIDVDKISLTYVAKGHVHFTQGTRSGHADLALLDEGKHTLDLVGDANVLDGDRRAAAAKMHYDMLEKDFLGAGDVRIYEPLPTPGPQASGTPAPKRRRRLPL